MAELDRDVLAQKVSAIPEVDREPYLKALREKGYTWRGAEPAPEPDHGPLVEMGGKIAAAITRATHRLRDLVPGSDQEVKDIGSTISDAEKLTKHAETVGQAIDQSLPEFQKVARWDALKELRPDLRLDRAKQDGLMGDLQVSSGSYEGPTLEQSRMGAGEQQAAQEHVNAFKQYAAGQGRLAEKIFRTPYDLLRHGPDAVDEDVINAVSVGMMAYGGAEAFAHLQEMPGGFLNAVKDLPNFYGGNFWRKAVNRERALALIPDEDVAKILMSLPKGSRSLAIKLNPQMKRVAGAIERGEISSGPSWRVPVSPEETASTVVTAAAVHPAESKTVSEFPNVSVALNGAKVSSSAEVPLDSVVASLRSMGLPPTVAGLHTAVESGRINLISLSKVEQSIFSGAAKDAGIHPDHEEAVANLHDLAKRRPEDVLLTHAAEKRDRQALEQARSDVHAKVEEVASRAEVAPPEAAQAAPEPQKEAAPQEAAPIQPREAAVAAAAEAGQDPAVAAAEHHGALHAEASAGDLDAVEQYDAEYGEGDASFDPAALEDQATPASAPAATPWHAMDKDALLQRYQNADPTALEGALKSRDAAVQAAVEADQEHQQAEAADEDKDMIARVRARGGISAKSFKEYSGELAEAQRRGLVRVSGRDLGRHVEAEIEGKHVREGSSDTDFAERLNQALRRTSHVFKMGEVPAGYSVVAVQPSPEAGAVGEYGLPEKPDASPQMELNLAYEGRDAAAAGKSVVDAVRNGEDKSSTGIAEDIMRKGVASLIGKKAKTIEDIGEMAALLRHPDTEFLGFFGFDKDDRLVDAQVRTAGLAAAVKMDPADWEALEAFAADPRIAKVVMPHNHPSGNPTLSREDLGVGAEAKRRLGSKFGGILATDDDEFEHAESVPATSGDQEHAMVGRFKFKTPKERFPGRGEEKVTRRAEVAAAAHKRLKEGSAYMVLCTGSDAKVLAAEGVMPDQKLLDRVKDGFHRHRAAQVFVVAMSDYRTNLARTSLLAEAFNLPREVRDVFAMDASGSITSPDFERNGMRTTSIIGDVKNWRVAEELPRYMGGQGMDSDDFARAIEESEVKPGSEVTMRVRDADMGVKRGEKGKVIGFSVKDVLLLVQFPGMTVPIEVGPEDLVETNRRPAARVAMEAALKAEKVSGQPSQSLRKTIAGAQAGLDPASRKVEIKESAALWNQLRAEERGGVQAMAEARKSVRAAVKEAGVQGKWEEATRRKIVEFAQVYLPKSERAALLTKVAQARTHEDFLEAFWQIDRLAVKATNKRMVKDALVLIDRVMSSKTFPVGVKLQIRELFSDVRLENWTNKTLEILASQQALVDAARASGESVDVPQALMEKIARMHLRPLADLDPRDMADILADLRFLVARGNDFRFAAADMAEHSRLELLNEVIRGTVKLEAPTTTRESKRKFLSPAHSWVDQQRGKLLRVMDMVQAVGVHLSPVQAVIDDLDGTFLGGGPNRRLWESIQDGYIGKVAESTVTDAFMAALIKEHGVLDQQQAERVLTVAYRDQGDVRPHLHKMGVTDEQIDAVVLTPKEQATLDAMRGYFASPDNIAALTRVSAELFNKEFVQVKNYFPIMTLYDPAQPGTSLAEMVANELDVRRKNVNRGRIIERTVGAARRLRTDLYGIFQDAARQQANLKHVAKPVLRVHGVVSDRAYHEAAGDVGAAFWKDLLDIIVRDGRRPTSGIDLALNYFRRNLNVAALTGKPNVFAIQLSSMGSGATVVGARNLAAAIGAGKEWDGFVNAHMPLVKGRAGGDQSVHEAMSGEVLSKAAALGYRPMVVADHWAAEKVALAAYFQYVDSAGLPRNPEQPDKKALAYAQSVTGRAMASPWLVDMPLALSRGNALVRGFLQFQSETLAVYRLMKSQAANAAKDPVGAAEDVGLYAGVFMYEAGVRLAWQHGVMLSLLGLGAVSAKEYAEWRKKHDGYWKQVAYAAFQKIPVIGSIANSVVYDAGPIPVFDVGVDAIKGSWNLATGTIDGKPIKQAKGLVNAVTSMASLAGVPFAGVTGYVAKQALKGKRDQVKRKRRFKPA